MNYDISRIGIEQLNAMQEDMLRECRRRNSVVLLSPTGTGKTIAYLLPVLEQMDGTKETLQTVVIVPSRELAVQTVEVIKGICPQARPVALYGGRPAMDEHRTLRGQQPLIVVATPGRMLDHLQKGNISADGVETVVIDEFDKSLELGFQPQMEAVMGFMDNVRRRILLSATESPQIPRFVNSECSRRLSYLGQGGNLPDGISLHRVRSAEKDKLGTLSALLRSLGEGKSLVFVNYRQSVERVHDFLRKEGFHAGMYHGGMEQKDRERALYRFVGGACNILVSTDLASRGLDIPDVNNIIHYHLPLDEEAYIHRNGRTARWDMAGDAYIITGPDETLPAYCEDDAADFAVPSDLPLPAPPHWALVYIGKGKKDKISKGDVAGFLSKAGGLERGQVGRIDVLPGWSYASVDRKSVKTLLAKVRGQKIKGIKTIFDLAE